MPEEICPYCKAEIRPLDKHAVQVKHDSHRVIAHPDGTETKEIMQEVSCVLTRYLSVKVTQDY
jgi:glutaredoxin